MVLRSCLNLSVWTTRLFGDNRIKDTESTKSCSWVVSKLNQGGVLERCLLQSTKGVECSLLSLSVIEKINGSRLCVCLVEPQSFLKRGTIERWDCWRCQGKEKWRLECLLTRRGDVGNGTVREKGVQGGRDPGFIILEVSSGLGSRKERRKREFRVTSWSVTVYPDGNRSSCDSRGRRQGVY